MKLKKFTKHLKAEGIVLDGENNLDDVIKAMKSFHVNSSVEAILNAFSTLKDAQESGAETIFVKNWLNHGHPDIKLTLEEEGTNGSLINGWSGQPTNHCG